MTGSGIITALNECIQLVLVLSVKFDHMTIHSTIRKITDYCDFYPRILTHYTKLDPKSRLPWGIIKLNPRNHNQRLHYSPSLSPCVPTLAHLFPSIDSYPNAIKCLESHIAGKIRLPGRKMNSNRRVCRPSSTSATGPSPPRPQPEALLSQAA